jgi:hypothetical protein
MIGTAEEKRMGKSVAAKGGQEDGLDALARRVLYRLSTMDDGNG